MEAGASEDGHDVSRLVLVEGIGNYEAGEVGRMLYILNRIWNCLYAYTHGYFWLPCSLCGRYRGGHEKSGSLYTGWGGGRGVCERCAEKAREMSVKRLKWESTKYHLELSEDGRLLYVYEPGYGPGGLEPTEE